MVLFLSHESVNINLLFTFKYLIQNLHLVLGIVKYSNRLLVNVFSTELRYGILVPVIHECNLLPRFMTLSTYSIIDALSITQQII